MSDIDDKRLYHGTSVYCLAGIIEEDCLRVGAHWGKPDEPNGPRLTECPEVAASFIEYCAYWAEGGYIVLDRARLAEDYELVAYHDKSYDGVSWGEEKEVAVLTERIHPLSKYLVSFVIDPAVINAALDDENVETALSEGGYPERFDEDFPSLAKKALDCLRNSPFLNADPAYSEFPIVGNWETDRAGVSAKL